MEDDRFLSEAAKVMEYLASLSPDEYWQSHLPAADDEKLMVICDMYMNATFPQKEVFVSGLTGEKRWLFGDFATRMAMLSVRTDSPSILVRGLVALALELESPDTLDERGVLMTLSILHHSAVKLGNAEGLFLRAVQHATKFTTRQLFLGYLARSPEDKRIQAMGWEELAGPRGIVYRWQFTNTERTSLDR